FMSSFSPRREVATPASPAEESRRRRSVVSEETRARGAFMLGQLRSAAARLPVVGPAVKRLYLTLFTDEGRVRPIVGGPLAGMRYHRYRWSTPREDLVETNWDDEAAGAFVRLINGKRRFF